MIHPVKRVDAVRQMQIVLDLFLQRKALVVFVVLPGHGQVLPDALDALRQVFVFPDEGRVVLQLAIVKVLVLDDFHFVPRVGRSGGVFRRGPLLQIKRNRFQPVRDVLITYLKAKFGGTCLATFRPK